MSIKEDLTKIVGAQNVLDDEEVLSSFSGDESFVAPGKPWCVTRPANAEEVREVVQWANEKGIPLIPVSSPAGPRFRGDTIASQGGVVVDLSSMNKILNIDRRDRVAMIEPGVTFDQLDLELRKQGLRVLRPLLPRKGKSVLASYLEREPTLVPKEHWDTIDPLICAEIVFGTGDVHRTGSAAGPGTIQEQLESGMRQINPIGPASVTLSRVVQGAQGSLGIVTWATVVCGRVPALQKPLFVVSEDLAPLNQLAYSFLRGRMGEELFLMNRTAMAHMAGEDAEGISKLCRELPPYILFINLASLDYFPEEKIQYQEKMVRDYAQVLGLDVRGSVGGCSGTAFLELLEDPPQTFYKMKYKGGCQDIFFKTTLDKTPYFIKEMSGVLETRAYPLRDMGIYLQPVVQGSSCHCEFFFPFDPADPSERDCVEDLYINGSQCLARSGAFFSRPYGAWAETAFGMDAETTAALRKVKHIFDPRGIMNPGKLCY